VVFILFNHFCVSPDIHLESSWVISKVWTV
jgi:hypothetical protein